MRSLLETLTKEELERVKIVTLKKEQILFNEGDVCECVGVVSEGEIEITSYSYGGKEIIFNHLVPGMVFGNNLIFSSSPLYKGSIIAKKPSKVALIYKNQLISLLKTNNDFLLKYLQYQSDMGKDLNGKIKLLSLDNAEERFFYYLHSQNGIITFSSITKLASTLSLQRETLSRLISRLVKENKLIKDTHVIKINK